MHLLEEFEKKPLVVMEIPWSKDIALGSFTIQI
jgi:hypothetical protein